MRGRVQTHVDEKNAAKSGWACPGADEALGVRPLSSITRQSRVPEAGIAGEEGRWWLACSSVTCVGRCWWLLVQRGVNPRERASNVHDCVVVEV